MSTDLTTRELQPAPLCGRADPDQPPWVAAGPAAGHRRTAVAVLFLATCGPNPNRRLANIV